MTFVKSLHIPHNEQKCNTYFQRNTAIF